LFSTFGKNDIDIISIVLTIWETSLGESDKSGKAKQSNLHGSDGARELSNLTEYQDVMLAFYTREDLVERLQFKVRRV